MNRAGRTAVVVAMIALLAAAAPAMRASAVSLRHPHGISRSGFFSLGTLTVTSCRREWLPNDWTCRGDYRVTDPLGDAGNDRNDIVLANDFRRHAAGTRIDVATISRSEAAVYLFGSGQLARVAVFWLGILAGTVALASMFVPWRRVQFGGMGAVVVAVLLLSPTLSAVWS